MNSNTTVPCPWCSDFDTPGSPEATIPHVNRVRPSPLKGPWAEGGWICTNCGCSAPASRWADAICWSDKWVQSRAWGGVERNTAGRFAAFARVTRMAKKPTRDYRGRLLPTEDTDAIRLP